MLVGWIDKVEGQITGWAYDDEQPEVSVELELYIDGHLFKVVRASLPRADLVILGSGMIDYGFSIEAPAGMRSDAVVFGKYHESYVVQTRTARKGHLMTRVSHPVVVDHAEIRETIYSGPSTLLIPAMINRICSAVVRAERDGEADYGPLWGMLVARGHGAFLDMIRSARVDELTLYLAEVGRQPVTFGFFDGPDAHIGAETNPQFRAAAATLIFDRLLSLAEALGCIKVENPEQGTWGDVVKADIDGLLASVAKALGVSDLRAPIGGFWGLPTRFGTMNVRVLDAIYAASRILQIRRQCGLTGVTEIGGGAGLTAHYSLLMGVDRYKIIDLPTVGAVQACTLQSQSGLRLYGEEPSIAKVELLPTWEFTLADNYEYSLLFNMDSLPEIDTQSAVQYLRDARLHGYRYLLSINQESAYQVGEWSQGTVQNLADQAGGYIRLSRHRDWMRPGYIEELYEIIPL